MCVYLNSWTYIFMNLKLRACFDLCWHLLRDGMCGDIKIQSPSLGTREIWTVPQWTLRKRRGYIPISRVYLQNWMESLLKDFTICPQSTTTPRCFSNSTRVSQTPASLILASLGKFVFFTKMLHLCRKGVPRLRLDLVLWYTRDFGRGNSFFSYFFYETFMSSFNSHFLSLFFRSLH